ncbi:flagellar biosynthesis protein FlgA [Micromonospora sp. NPDC000089]|uniref:flagellar biosynthesis protein FlgA n=1 Tax=unclassified Micromonospora TaxID=2617518 RepID=UPI0036D14C48
MTSDGRAGTRALRPVRWPRRPSGGTLLRAGLVAALLGLAVLILDAPPGCPGPDPRSSVGAGSNPTTAPGPASRTGPPRDVAPTTGGGPGAESAAGGAARSAALPLPAGAVGLPVRLAEPAALAVLRPGARVDLLVVPAGRTAAEATLLAAGAQVLDVLGGDGTDGSAALYLALRPDQARRAVGQPEGSRFAVVVRG